MYIGLKIYSNKRSRIFIDILHTRGICILYERTLKVTQRLSEATLNLFEHEKALGGSKVDSAFHLSEVDKMSTRNFWELNGKK